MLEFAEQYIDQLYGDNPPTELNDVRYVVTRALSALSTELSSALKRIEQLERSVEELERDRSNLELQVSDLERDISSLDRRAT